MAGGLILLALVGGLVEVEGSTTCPSPGEVAARLAALLPEGEPGPGPAANAVDHARLRPGRRSIEIELRAAGGASLVERRLDGSSPCGELAAAAAVVIAAWESELRPGVVPSVALLPRRPPRRPIGYEIAAGFVASLIPTSGDLAPGGMLEASFGPTGSGFGGRLALLGVAERDLSLGSGKASWTRASLSLGPRYRFTPWRLLVDLHAEALAALLVVAGSNYNNTNLQEIDIDPGLGGGVRVAIRLGPIALHLGVSVAGWLRSQTIQVKNADTNMTVSTTTLPRLELLFTAGLGTGRF